VIAIRVEKLRFLTEEMHLAFHLATHVPDPFSARTLARNILVRAENFIAHARGLRRPLNLAGHDTWEFHNKKEIYATNFEEYLPGRGRSSNATIGPSTAARSTHRCTV
jgi:hypothetical protein